MKNEVFEITIKFKSGGKTTMKCHELAMDKYRMTIKYKGTVQVIHRVTAKISSITTDYIKLG